MKRFFLSAIVLSALNISHVTGDEIPTIHGGDIKSMEVGLHCVKKPNATEFEQVYGVYMSIERPGGDESVFLPIDGSVENDYIFAAISQLAANETQGSVRYNPNEVYGTVMASCLLGEVAAHPVTGCWVRPQD